jgi:hypothetical protein
MADRSPELQHSSTRNIELTLATRVRTKLRCRSLVAAQLNPSGPQTVPSPRFRAVAKYNIEKKAPPRGRFSLSSVAASCTTFETPFPNDDGSASLSKPPPFIPIAAPVAAVVVVPPFPVIAPITVTSYSDAHAAWAHLNVNLRECRHGGENEANHGDPEN